MKINNLILFYFFINDILLFHLKFYIPKLLKDNKCLILWSKWKCKTRKGANRGIVGLATLRIMPIVDSVLNCSNLLKPCCTYINSLNSSFLFFKHFYLLGKSSSMSRAITSPCLSNNDFEINQPSTSNYEKVIME